MRARTALPAAIAALLLGCAAPEKAREPSDLPEPAPAAAEATEAAEPEAPPAPPEDVAGAAEVGDAEPGEPPEPASTPSEDPPANPLADWGSDVGLRGLSNDGAWRVKYLTDPDPIPLNEPFAVEVAVFAAEDTSRPAEGIALALDAAMPQHRHGMLRIPRVEARPDGTYAVSGVLFHMPGYWELYLDVTRGAVTERTQFAIEID